MNIAKLLASAIILLSVLSSQIIFANDEEEKDANIDCTLNSNGQNTHIEIQIFADEDYSSLGESGKNNIYVYHEKRVVISNHTHLQKLRTRFNSDVLVSALETDGAMSKWHEENKDDLKYIIFYEIPGHVVARFMRKKDTSESWAIQMFRPNHNEIIEFLASDCREKN